LRIVWGGRGIYSGNVQGLVNSQTHRLTFDQQAIVNVETVNQKFMQANWAGLSW